MLLEAVVVVLWFAELALDQEVLGSIAAPSKLFLYREHAFVKFVWCQLTQKKNGG